MIIDVIIAIWILVGLGCAIYNAFDSPGPASSFEFVLITAFGPAALLFAVLSEFATSANQTRNTSSSKPIKPRPQKTSEELQQEYAKSLEELGSKLNTVSDKTPLTKSDFR